MELRLKEVCEKKGKTRADIEADTGLKKGYLSDLFNGKCNPTIETIEKVANSIGVEIWELFTDSTSKDELTALINYRGEFYKASTITELETIIQDIKTK